MTTIIISTDITATLSDLKAEQYRNAVDATRNYREALLSDQWSWHDLADWEECAWTAWEEFFS